MAAILAATHGAVTLRLPGRNHSGCRRYYLSRRPVVCGPTRDAAERNKAKPFMQPQIARFAGHFVPT
eukprot:scaffold582562_cov18-Prasinocladus_malaysianus.AAC.1